MTLLEEYFATAREEEAKLHGHCQVFFQGALTYAKNVGAALEAAFQCVARRGVITWDDAVDKYFGGSRRSADNYRRIFKNKGKIERSIESGEIQPSIAAALELLRPKSVKRKKKSPPENDIPEKENDNLRERLEYVQWQLMEWSEALDEVEQSAMFDSCDEHLRRMYRSIKSAVIFNDPYYYEDRDHWDLEMDTGRSAQQRAEDTHREVILRSQRKIKRIRVAPWPGETQRRYELVKCD